MKITPVCTVDKLHFEPEFFQDEVREGFYVSTMIKRYWAAQLVVLSEIAAICDRHGLKWFADCGSLIGVIRHEGFIPWDDDLDICMLREDWDKFFEAAKEELPDGYKILTIKEEPEYEQIIGRISGSAVIDVGSEHLERFYGCPYTVGVDIFPLDGVYEDEGKEEERKKRAERLVERYNKETSPQERRRLIQEIERVYSECLTTDATYVALMPFFVSRNNHKYPKVLFEHVAKLPFENIFINVPARYEEVLAIEYKNYMKVVKAWNYHDYPVYADQELTLKESIGRNPFRYTFNLNELLLSIKRYTLKLINPPVQREKEIVVFLPCKASWWSAMEPLWDQYSADDSKEVHVLPIFYYDCDYNGNIGDKHDEREDFPEYLNVEACEKFDFEGLHPDKIIIQVPYDGWNSAMTVHEFFYSDNLLNFTEELIYVPCFDMDPPQKFDDKAAAAILPYIEQPAVVNADRIILKDEMMRSLYLERLVQLSSEETRGYWENKIVLMESNDDPECTTCDISQESMRQWHDFLGDHKERKTIIYYVTISMIARHGDQAIDKIRRSIDIFENSGDGICAIFEPQINLEENFREMNPILLGKYVEIVESIQSKKNVLFDQDGIALLHIDQWNAYYGEQGAIAHKCQIMGIPVMIENTDI